VEPDTGKQLIDQLLEDPFEFDKKGRAYQLLQCYFDGYPRETLRPLLKSDNRLVQKAAAFIISELGGDARDLLDAIIPLMQSGDRYLKYQAMEALTVCADAEQAEKFIYVPLELEGDDEVLRSLAMRLMVNADSNQLAAAGRVMDAEGGRDVHSRALATLASEKALELDRVTRMLSDPAPLVRRYGAIAAKRLWKRLPSFLSRACSITDDPELLKYFREVE
jgi:hypothetical protein